MLVRFSQLFMRLWFLWEQISVKRWKGWKYSSLLCCPVCLFCWYFFLCVKVYSLSFCFTEHVNWNRWPSVELTSCVDFDKCGRILLAESAWVSLRVSRDVRILRYPNGHHCAYIIFTDNTVSPLFQRQTWVWLWFYISWGLNISLRISEFKIDSHFCHNHHSCDLTLVYCIDFYNLINN